MNALSRYIRNSLIYFHTNKTPYDGYECDVEKIPACDQYDFIEMLFKHDPAFKEQALMRMQELVDENLLFAESQDKYDSGLVPVNDPQTGEVQWRARA
jgi:hypothetical protein